MGDEAAAGVMKNREAWLLVMPELGGGHTQAGEMLKWIICECRALFIAYLDEWCLTIDIPAFHDAFQLYGRPKAYTWDPRDPASLMFGYPVGAGKDVCIHVRALILCCDIDKNQ